MADVSRAARAVSSPRRGDREVVAEDLYLALACADGNEAAIAALRDTLVPALRQALGKLGDDARDDRRDRPARARDGVRRRRQARRRSRRTPGAARLRSWLRTIGVRTGRRLLGLEARFAVRRRAAPTCPPRSATRSSSCLRERYRDQVKHAFAAAFAELAERERNVLRQYHIDGLTIDQLADALPGQPRDHGALGGRRAARGRSPRTRKQLVEHYGIAATEVDSIIRLVRSQLDVSVRDIAN